MYLQVLILAFILVTCSASESTSSIAPLVPNIGHKDWNGKPSIQIISSEIPSDGWHPIVSSRYDEMWYFDCQTRTGEVIVSSITVYGNINKNATVRVYLDIYKKSGQALHFTSFYNISEFFASLDRLNVTVGCSFALTEGSSIRIYLSNNTISCYLKYTPEASPWVSRMVARETYSTWFVPVPRADVVGWYNISGEIHMVSGVGYHDHSWDVSPKIYTEKEGVFLGYPFVWGRVHTKDITVLFAQAPAGCQVACVFFKGEIIEFDRIRFFIKDAQFFLSSYSKNNSLLMEIKVDYSEQLFVTETMELYRYLISAIGVFVSKDRSILFAGQGIMNLQSMIRSNETYFTTSIEVDK